MITHKVVSLFSGCGGGDLGFLGGFTFLGQRYKRLSFEIVWANDVDRFAADVHKHNIGVDIDLGDIKKVKFEKIEGIAEEVDVLVAGFPCQDFSLIGPRRGLTSDRGQLYKEIRRALRFFRPKLFLAENVPGIEHPQKILSSIVSGLSGRLEPTYKTTVYRVNAADYGVPQIRQRLLIIGIRRDLPNDFNPPPSVHRAPDSCSDGIPAWMKALMDSAYSSNGQLPLWITARECLEDLWDPSGPSGSKIADQEKLTHATIILGRPKRRDRRLAADLPSPTIRAQHHGHVEVHYDTQIDGTLRRLTIRECARLQGFPDTFTFPVSGTQAYRQIGNAMPPVMAHHWAEGIEAWLEREEERQEMAGFNSEGPTTRQRKHRDQAVTSRIMSSVRGKNSKAERMLGSAMWGLGLRYRKHARGIVGLPDFVFIGPRIAVFCDGDFWHGKGWERRGFRSWDEQFEGLRNAEFWREKIAKNMSRDRVVNAELINNGWAVLRYLESEILENPAKYAECVRATVEDRK